MHHVSHLEISNFKSCQSVCIDLAPFTPLVGYNNAGKSNILDALVWVLKRSSLSDASFFDVTRPVKVDATISGVSDDILQALAENHRKKIEPYIQNEQILIRREQTQPNDSTTEIRLSIWDHRVSDDEKWVLNPTGIENAIKALLPEPIRIGAMENATEDLSKASRTSTIGKLIQEIIAPIREEHLTKITNALTPIRNMLSAEGEARPDALTQMDEHISGEIAKFFPGISARIDIPTPDLDLLAKGGTLKIFESEQPGRDVNSLGHGAQRAAQMAMIKALAEVRRNQNTTAGTTLLIIDEPELYLHPQAIEHIRAALKLLSSEGYQVLFSTHSPQMITSEDVTNTLIIYKNADGTVPRERLHNAIDGALEGAENQLETLFLLSNSSRFLFSEQVILAEGPTERRVFPEVFAKITSKTLEERKLAFIDVGGTGNIPNTRAVLNAMGFKVKVIVDLDFAFKVAERHGLLSEDDPDLSACRKTMVELAKDHGFQLDENGLPRNPKPEEPTTISAAEAFEILAAFPKTAEHINHLHQKLRTANCWLWTKGTIEKHLGLAGKKLRIQARYVKDLKETNDFRQIVADHETVKQLCQWLAD